MTFTLPSTSRAATTPAPNPLPSTGFDSQIVRLLRSPAGSVVAARVGEATVRADLSASLAAIDAALGACPQVIPPHLADVFGGGKRLRPLLVVAASRASAAPVPGLHRRVVLGASAVELLHLASLVHDDIMDGALTRHGVGTISARGGTGAALLAGDCLLGHAHAAAAELGGRAAQLLARTLVRLCEGQAEEWSTVFDVERSMRSYYSAIGGKTGSLVEAACRMGSLAAGHPARTTTALGRFGHHLGLGYQLRDDLLDLTADAESAGKPVGHDLANGVYTYPTLWALHYDPELAPLLRAVAQPGEGSDRTRWAAAVAQRVRASGAQAATRQAIRNERVRCLAALTEAVEGIGPHGVALLAELTDTVLDQGLERGQAPLPG